MMLSGIFVGYVSHADGWMDRMATLSAKDERNHFRWGFLNKAEAITHISDGSSLDGDSKTKWNSKGQARV